MEKPNNDPVPLFNPLREDFSCEWLNDKNEPVILTMPAREISYFPPHQARFMAKHMADAVYNRRGGTLNAEDDYKEIYKEIQVKL